MSAALAALILTAAPPAAASATPAPGNTATLPQAPVSENSASGALATSPGISPSTDFEHKNSGETYTCNVGTLCAIAWDPVYGKWKVFKLYYCNTYSLSYWNGGGFYWNNQTSGTTGHVYGSSGQVIKDMYTNEGQQSYNWDPAWKIKNC